MGGGGGGIGRRKGGGGEGGSKQYRLESSDFVSAGQPVLVVNM